MRPRESREETIFSPGQWASHASRLCECWQPALRPPPALTPTVRGKEAFPSRKYSRGRRAVTLAQNVLGVDRGNLRANVPVVFAQDSLRAYSEGILFEFKSRPAMGTVNPLEKKRCSTFVNPVFHSWWKSLANSVLLARVIFSGASSHRHHSEGHEICGAPRREHGFTLRAQRSPNEPEIQLLGGRANGKRDSKMSAMEAGGEQARDSTFRDGYSRIGRGCVTAENA